MSLLSNIQNAHYKLSMAQSSADYSSLRHGEVAKSLVELRFVVDRVNAILRDLDRRLTEGVEEFVDLPRDVQSRLGEVHEAMTTARRCLGNAERGTQNAAVVYERFVSRTQLATTHIDHR